MFATKRLPFAFVLGAMLVTAACGGTSGNLGAFRRSRRPRTPASTPVRT